MIATVVTLADRIRTILEPPMVTNSLASLGVLFANSNAASDPEMLERRRRIYSLHKELQAAESRIATLTVTSQLNPNLARAVQELIDAEAALEAVKLRKDVHRSRCLEYGRARRKQNLAAKRNEGLPEGFKGHEQSGAADMLAVLVNSEKEALPKDERDVKDRLMEAGFAVIFDHKGESSDAMRRTLTELAEVRSKRRDIEGELTAAVEQYELIVNPPKPLNKPAFRPNNHSARSGHQGNTSRLSQRFAGGGSRAKSTAVSSTRYTPKW